MQFGLKLDTSAFFDRLVVEDATDKAEKMALGKLGSFIYTTAKRSMRRRKGKVSPPGHPPYAHSPTKASLKMILFQYDAKQGSVVVGPLRFNTRTNVAKLMEFGGMVKPRKGRIRHYRKRRFMGPAMEQESPKLPSMYAQALARVDKRKARRRS